MDDIALGDIATPAAFCAMYPHLQKTLSAIRWDIFNAARNGLEEAGAIVRRGRRVYVVVPRYRDWLLGKVGRPGHRAA